MQTLEVISVNLWQILISLVNLTLLFLILKKFLFKPVTRVLEKRQSELDAQYAAAEAAEALAAESKSEWEERLAHASEEADAILADATESAKRRRDAILKEAGERADGMIRAAESEIELMERRADEQLKEKIVEVSGALTEQLLAREIDEKDHRTMIDAFLTELGDEDGRRS